jgi:GNAT superfamily N-acetyltransferase
MQTNGQDGTGVTAESHASLRPATISDLEVLIRQRRAMWQEIAHFPDAELDDADGVYRRWLRTKLRSRKALAWIVEYDGRPVASGVVVIVDHHPRVKDPNGAIPYLMSMYTDVSFRRRGFARRIVNAAIAWARTEGFPTMELHAAEGGRRLYESMGFAPTNEMRLRLT